MRSVARVLKQRELQTLFYPSAIYLHLHPSASSACSLRALRTPKRHASTATLQAPDALEILPQPTLTPPVVPVPGANSTIDALTSVRRLLAEEIGGADDWLRRTEAAIGDLAQLRRGRIAGEC
jgi:hypothetical protein